MFSIGTANWYDKSRFTLATTDCTSVLENKENRFNPKALRTTQISHNWQFTLLSSIKEDHQGLIWIITYLVFQWICWQAMSRAVCTPQNMLLGGSSLSHDMYWTDVNPASLWVHHCSGSLVFSGSGVRMCLTLSSIFYHWGPSSPHLSLSLS